MTNEEIARVLGWEWTEHHYEDVAGPCVPPLDYGPGWETNEDFLPEEVVDFDSSEVREKIRDKVRELWCAPGRQVHVEYDGIWTNLFLMTWVQGEGWKNAHSPFSFESESSAWLAALKWLTKEKK